MHNEHFSVPRGTNYHISSTLLYEHIPFCSLSMSEYLTTTSLTETATDLLKVLFNIQPTLLSCKLKGSVQSKVMDSMLSFKRLDRNLNWKDDSKPLFSRCDNNCLYTILSKILDNTGSIDIGL